jgi:hypothetical protein
MNQKVFNCFELAKSQVKHIIQMTKTRRSLALASFMLVIAETDTIKRNVWMAQISRKHETHTRLNKRLRES